MDKFELIAISRRAVNEWQATKLETLPKAQGGAISMGTETVFKAREYYCYLWSTIYPSLHSATYARWIWVTIGFYTRVRSMATHVCLLAWERQLVKHPVLDIILKIHVKKGQIVCCMLEHHLGAFFLKQYYKLEWNVLVREFKETVQVVCFQTQKKAYICASNNTWYVM